jgi:hypothetical protein
MSLGACWRRPPLISDFYEHLRIFGSEHGVEAFQLQVPQFATAESNEWMSRFMGHFAELSGRPGPFGATYLDFSNFDPRTERTAHYERLLGEEYFDYRQHVLWRGTQSGAAAIHTGSCAGRIGSSHKEHKCRSNQSPVCRSNFVARQVRQPKNPALQ